MFIPRQYQIEAINAGADYFCDKKAKYNGMIILPTGSGKSIVISKMAAEVNKRMREMNKPQRKFVILQPSKEILLQNFRKYTSQGFRAGIYSASMKVKHVDDICFATIGSIIKKKHLFEKHHDLLIDECFPAGSLVDNTPIQQIKIGDIVKSYNHSTGCIENKRVVHIFKKRILGELLKVRLFDGTEFICTDNHPIYTNEYGYIPAKDLTLCKSKTFTLLKEYEKNNTSLHCLRNRSNKKRTRKKLKCFLFPRVFNYSQRIEKGKPEIQLPSVRKGIFGNWENGFILQQKRKSILHIRMRRDKSSYWNIRTRKNSFSKSSMAKGAISQNEKKQSYVDARYIRKNGRIQQRKNIFRTGWKWATDKTTNDFALGNSFPNGIPNNNSGSKTFIQIRSNLLQGRFSLGRKENSNRGRWRISQAEEMEIFRPQENRNTKCVGVESVEVYKSGDRQKCSQSRETDYVYNIEVEDNHNYFVSNILVHNCHKVNSDAGMYEEFINSYDDCKVIGLTATPYRLESSQNFGSMLKFLNRTNPRIFNKVLYYVQNDVLFDAGHLAPLKYFSYKTIDRGRLETNSTGTDFTQASVEQAYKEVDMIGKIQHYANRILAKANNLLIFCTLNAEAYAVAAGIPGSVVVTGETETGLRSRILKDFELNKIRCVVNCKVLDTGYDKPDLEAVLIGRSTMSMALYYQMIGRVMRPHTYPDESKKTGWVIDLGGNIEMFGKIETMKIINDNEKYSVWNYVNGNPRQLTNTVFRKI